MTRFRRKTELSKKAIASMTPEEILNELIRRRVLFTLVDGQLHFPQGELDEGLRELVERHGPEVSALARKIVGEVLGEFGDF